MKIKSGPFYSSTIPIFTIIPEHLTWKNEEGEGGPPGSPSWAPLHKSGSLFLKFTGPNHALLFTVWSLASSPSPVHQLLCLRVSMQIIPFKYRRIIRSKLSTQLYSPNTANYMTEIHLRCSDMMNGKQILPKYKHILGCRHHTFLLKNKFGALLSPLC